MEEPVKPPAKPDWIAATLSGQLKDTASLIPLNLKANDFDLRPAKEYWSTPGVKEYFKNDEKAFGNFYSTQLERFQKTQKSDHQLNINAEVMSDKYSARPLISYNYKMGAEDPWGRERFGDFYGPKQWGIREKAAERGVKIGDKYVPIDQYKGDAVMAKNADGSYATDENGRFFWRPLAPDEEMRSFDETYSPFAHEMGIYGVDRNYMKEGAYTLARSIPDFLNRTADSLLELPRQVETLGPFAFDSKEMAKLQSGFRTNLMPTTEAQQENFWDPVSIASLGLDSVYQLASMAGVVRTAKFLGAGAKTASAAGRVYMTGMSAGPIAQISREHGLSPTETAVLFGANAAAIYKISNLSDMIVSGIRPLEFNQRAAVEFQKAYGMTIAKKGINESSLKSFQNTLVNKFEGLIASMSSKPLVQGAFLEGLEETAEQGVDSGLRGMHDIMAPLLSLDGNYNWDMGQELDSLVKSFAGGAIGGSIMHPIMKKMGMHERSTIDTVESAVANNDEGFLYKMADKWEKGGRFGATSDENKKNASAFNKIINTMVEIRDKAGLKDALTNNQRAAGAFTDILKRSSIGRDKIVLGNELYTLENRLQAAVQAKATPPEIERLTKEVETKKAEIEKFNSGDQVHRYITEGLYNVESSKEFRGQSALHSSDHFNGKYFLAMNEDTVKHAPSLRERVDMHNKKLVENDTLVTPDNYSTMQFTETGRTKILSELSERRAPLLEKIKANEELINKSLMYSPVNVVFDSINGPEDSENIQEDLEMNYKDPAKKAALEAMPWYKDLAELFNVDSQIRKAANPTRTKTSEPLAGVTPDEWYFYDFEEGKSTVPLYQRLDTEMSNAGLGERSEEAIKKSALYVSNEPKRLVQVLEDRINQITGVHRLKNNLKYDKIIAPDLLTPDKTLNELQAIKAGFEELNRLSEENLNNTEKRIMQVYIKSLSKNLDTVRNAARMLGGKHEELVDVINNYDAELQEAVDKNDHVAYRAQLFRMEKNLYDGFGEKRQTILQDMELKKAEVNPEELARAKASYDYMRGILAVDPAVVYSSLYDFLNNTPAVSKTATREQQAIILTSVQNALAGDYRWKPDNTMQRVSLSFTSGVDGSSGTGKTTVVIPGIAHLVNKMTNGKVIITAAQDTGGRKKQKVRADVENYFQSKPGYIQYSDLSLIDIIKSKEVDGVNAIIFDEAGLLSKEVLDQINTELNKENTKRLKDGKIPLHLFYTYDSYQNGYRPTGSKRSYSITSESVNIPATPRLSFSFRSVNSPLKAAEELFRVAQQTKAKPQQQIFEHDDDGNGVMVVKTKEDLEKAFIKLAEKQKLKGELNQVAYINANSSSKGVPALGQFSVQNMTSIESQGSEWDFAVIDSSTGDPFGSVADTQEFYTAVTRARKGAILFVAPDVKIDSVKGTVRQFTAMKPADVAKADILAELNTIIGDQKTESNYTAKNITVEPPTTKTPDEAPVVPEKSQDSPKEQIRQAEELVNAEEKQAYLDIVAKYAQGREHITMNTFFDASGSSIDTKKRLMFDEKLQGESEFFVTVARIGSPGYQLGNGKSIPAYEDKYGIFIEAKTPTGERVILGTISREYGDEKERTTAMLKEAGVLKDGSGDVLAHIQVSKDILRQSYGLHPWIQNTSTVGSQVDRTEKQHNMSSITSQASKSNIAVSPVLVASDNIASRNNPNLKHLLVGDPFVILSYKHSEGDLARLTSEGKLPIDDPDITLLPLRRNGFDMDRVKQILTPYFSRNADGYFSLPRRGESNYSEANAIYNALWFNAASKTYTKIFNETMTKLAQTDPQVNAFALNQQVKKPGGFITLKSGAKKKVDAGYDVRYLLADYLAAQLETNPESRDRMSAGAKEKIFNAMLESSVFNGQLRYSPATIYRATGTAKYFKTQDVPRDVQDEAMFASFHRLDAPKPQIPIQPLLDQIKGGQAQQKIANASGQTTEDEKTVEVSGSRLPARPMNMAEFRRKEFPVEAELAKTAIDQFKRRVVNSHLQLTVPKGGVPMILNVADVMKKLREEYLAPANRESASRNKQSRINYALGRNFESLLANYFPAISYDAVTDTFSLNNGVYKTSGFSEQESQDLLTNGITSIVKTYLYTTPLPNGKYLTNRHVANLIPLFRGLDFEQAGTTRLETVRTIEGAEKALRRSKLPEARAILDRFFSSTPLDKGKDQVFSTYQVDSEAGQGLTNAMLQFFTKAEKYVPGFSEIQRKETRDEEGRVVSVRDTRIAKYPTGSFSPSAITGRFVDGFDNILRRSKIVLTKSGVTMNGREFSNDKISPSNAVEMVKAMGLTGFDMNSMMTWMDREPNADSVVQNYFMKSVKDYTNHQSPTVTPKIQEMLQVYSEEAGVGNDFSYIDMSGGRQNVLRDSSPIFHLHHYTSKIKAQQFSLLDTNLLVEGKDYRYSLSNQPFNNLGSKVGSPSADRQKSMDKMSASELLDVYLLDGFISPILSGKNSVSFPVTVYSDSGTELTPVFVSDKWMDSHKTVLNRIFDSRARYFTGLQNVVLEPYKQAGVPANSVAELAVLLQAMPETSRRALALQIQSSPNAVAGLHYDEQVMNRMIDLKIKPQLVADMAFYHSEGNRNVFVETIRKDVADVIEFSKQQTSSPDTLYDKIKTMTSEYSPDSLIASYYVNWLLVSSEFQKMMNGPEYQYKKSGADSFIDMVKRSRSLTSPSSFFVLRNDSWATDVVKWKAANPGKPLPFRLQYEGSKLSPRSKVFVVTDPEQQFLGLNNGNVINQKTMDGATLVTPFTRIKQDYSTARSYGPFVGPVMKNITHTNDVITGTKAFVKNAEFEITPEILQNGDDDIRDKFLRMIGPDAWEALKAAGAKEDFTNIDRDHFDKAFKSLVEAGKQDELVDEIIFQSSMKTGQRGVNQLDSPQYVPSYIDITMKGIQQDAMKEPYDGLDTKVLTQLVQAISTNWIDDAVLRDFYTNLSDITREYLDNLARIPEERRQAHYISIMHDDLLSTDGVNYRTDAAAVNRISINDRSMSGKYLETISGELKNMAVAFKLRGGQYVVHPATFIPIYDVVNKLTGEASTITRSQLATLDAAKFDVNPVGRQLKYEDAVRADGVTLTQLYTEARALLSPLDQTITPAYAQAVEAIHQSLQKDQWTKGQAEILLPAEMMREFMLEDAIHANTPIGAIDIPYFYNKILTAKERERNVIVPARMKQAEMIYQSFQTRLNGIMARIPTSGKHSSLSIKIAGFMNGSMNSVFVPPQLLAVQGADQDIDKGSYLTFKSITRYAMIDPNVKKGKEVLTYDPDAINHRHLMKVSSKSRHTGLIPFRENLLEIREMLPKMSDTEFKAVEKIARENDLVRSLKTILDNPKSIVEANTSTDDVLQPLRAERDAMLATMEGDPKKRLSFDKLMSLLKLHEMNQAGGKGLTGIFANSSKAYNVLYIMNKMTGTNDLAGLEGENEIWEQYAGYIGATVDNGNENILGPKGIDNTVAPFVGYLISTGATSEEIQAVINGNADFFERMRQDARYDKVKGFRIQDENADMQALFFRAQEFTILAQSLVNRDLPTRMEDVAAYVLSFENFVNYSYRDALQDMDFDLEKFSMDQDYQNEQVIKYERLVKENPSHANNILRVFRDVPHMKQYQRALLAAHHQAKAIKAYDLVFAAQKATADPKKPKQWYFYSKDKFNDDYNFVHGLFIDAYLNSRNTKSITDADISSSAGREQFIKEFHDDLPNLKAIYKANKLVSDLNVETSQATGETRLRLNDYYDMNDDIRALYMQEMELVEPIAKKRLFIYNLITTRDRNSLGSLTSFFSLDDKADFINFLDYEVAIDPADVIKVKRVRDEGKDKVSEQAIPFVTTFRTRLPVKVGERRYKEYAVHAVTNIKNSSLNADPVSRINIDGEPVIYVDNFAVKRGFDNKIWTRAKPLVDGTYPPAIPSHAFKSEDEFRTYLLELQYLSIKGSSTNIVELMDQALKNTGKQGLVRYKKEEKNKQDADNCGLKTDAGGKAPF